MTATRSSLQRPGSVAGYSLLEMMVVLAIAGMMMLVSVPNLLRWHETYLLKSDARGYASALKLGRMKAVANNVPYNSELDSAALRAQCGGQSGTNPPSIMVVYPQGTTSVEECFPGTRGLDAIEIVPDSLKTITFYPNGMAKMGTASPNLIKVTSRNKKYCQLVCVNTAGAVQLGGILEGPQCATPPSNCNIP